MLAKSSKGNGYIVMVRTDWPGKVLSDGETASAKRTQRTMQAAGGVAVLRKLTQPRNREDADGDALKKVGLKLTHYGRFKIDPPEREKRDGGSKGTGTQEMRQR